MSTLKIYKSNTDYYEIVAKIVKEGGVIIFPTDTLYGLGCDPTNHKAVKKILKIKKRSDKPLPVLCSSLNQVKRLIVLGKMGRKLAKEFWPGQLTIISALIDNDLPEELTAKKRTLGVRIPDHKETLKLIRYCGGSLVGTSVNISGYPSINSYERIIKLFGDKVDAIIYCKDPLIGIHSTVVEVFDESFRIIRLGAISADNLYSRTFN